MHIGGKLFRIIFCSKIATDNRPKFEAIIGIEICLCYESASLVTSGLHES